MDDGVKVFVGKELVQKLFVPDVPFRKADRLAGEFLQPVHDFGAGVAEVVQHKDIVAACQQFQDGMASNVAGAAGD